MRYLQKPQGCVFATLDGRLVWLINDEVGLLGTKLFLSVSMSNLLRLLTII